MVWLVKGYLLFWLLCAWGCVEFMAHAQDLPDVDVQDKPDLPGRKAGPVSSFGRSWDTDERQV